MATQTRTRGGAKAKASGGVKTEVSKTEERQARDEGFTKEILKRRKAGDKWGPIAEDLGITVGKAIFLFDKASVEDEITFKNDEDLGKKAVKARNSGLSWGKIAAATGVGEGKLKRLAAEAGLEANHRIGRGGRHPGTSEPAPKVRTRASAKAAAKAEPAAKTRVRTRVKR